MRNAYVFFRHVWFTPLLATIPLVLNIYFIFFYPPGHYNDIDTKLYFELFQEERMEVIRLIEDGTLRDNGQLFGIIRLPQPYTYLAMQDGLVVYMTNERGTSVVFSTGWDILSLDRGFCYIPDDRPSDWIRMGKLVDIEKMKSHWFLIYPAVDYIRYIMNIPGISSPSPAFLTPEYSAVPEPIKTHTYPK